MGDRSKIEWTEASWNPIRAANKVTGRDGHFCVHVSEGCRNCYAERMQKRFGNPVRFAAQDRDKVQIFLHETALTEPLRWKRPRRVFVCSMTDLFADFVTDEMIDQVFAVMALAPQHTFQVLTKRPERMRTYLQSPDRIRRIYETTCDLALETAAPVVLIAPGVDPSLAPAGTRVHLDLWPLPNVWLGTSVEDQAAAAARIPELLGTPAAVRWISAEPLLGALDVAWALSRNPVDIAAGFLLRGRFAPSLETLRPLGWVVVGGESGGKARPMHPDWARSLRDQCQAAGVPFFFKQWGAWAPITHSDAAETAGWEGKGEWMILSADGDLDIPDHRWPDEETGETAVVRVGKARAGRLLDGVTHDGYPEGR